MKHLFLFAAICIVTITVTSCANHRNNESVQEVPSIDVAEAYVDSIVLTRSYPTTLSANRAVDLVARVNGYLNTVNYTSGEYVREGTVLFTIESQTYADAVRQAEATLSSAHSSYDYASRQYSAMTKALESEAVSQMEVLQSKNNMENARAAIEQAEAALRTARTNLSYCTVRAPYDGHVSDRLITPGSYMSGGGSPVKLATIYDDASMVATFFVEDGYTPDITFSGAALNGIDYHHIPVSFTDTLSRSYTADVFYLDPAVNTSTGTVAVKAKIENPMGELRSGMYGTISLPYAVERDAVLVSDAAISTDQLGKYLYVVNDSDKVVYTPVQVGELYQDTLRVVKSGIRPGDRYVTKALLKVRDGMSVHPVNTSKR